VGTPIVIHTPHGHVFFGYFGPLRTKFFIRLEKIASLITDKIIALTNREKKDTIAFKVAKENKLTVIHSGIELDKFTQSSTQDIRLLKNNLGIPEKALIVGTAGRLVPIKGPEYLIKAAEKVLQIHKNIFFLFAGDGYLKEDLAALAQDLGIEKNILFLGWKDNAAEIISLYDIFVLPSLNEGMGRVLVEAMALGKPIVASNIGGIPDLIFHGKNGFLVPPQKPRELAQYIQLLLEDENKRTKMGQEGKKLSQNFSVEQMVQKIEGLYNHQLKVRKIASLRSR
jgi:glycosyltransferase involved in cell wall biosynthesis